MPLPAMEGALLLPIVSQLLPSCHPSVILSLKGFPLPQSQASSQGPFWPGGRTTGSEARWMPEDSSRGTAFGK